MPDGAVPPLVAARARIFATAAAADLLPTGFAGPASLFVAARVVNMLVGLAMIPLLIHSLGGQGFAAWAILLSCSAVFGELQLGIHTALVREVAITDRSAGVAVSRLWSSGMGFLVVVHAAAFPFVVSAARSVGEWLRLPNVGPWHPGTAVTLVFACVAVRSVLMTGGFALFASGRFGQAAALSLAQALASNTAATVIAWRTRDLAATLVGFWGAQLAVVAVGVVLARAVGWRPRIDFVSARVIRRLLAYGLKVQLAEWAQIINFQFDKFVIVRVLGLWPAALYEVSNRSVLALRSIPSSGMDTFLPVATRHVRGGEDVAAPRRMTVLALYGVLLFFAAPLVVAPLFLYAWVGEMGYVSRHVFAFLALGATANLLALPLAALAQAAGRPDVQAHAAVASILLNVPLSLALVRVWGVEGAALGSSLAMLLGVIVLFHQARGALGREAVASVVATLVRHWPLAITCLAWGVAVHLAFGRWFETTSIQLRYGLVLRAQAGGLALALYVCCLLTLVVAKLRLGGFEPEEQQMLARIAAIVGSHPRAGAPVLQDQPTAGEQASGISHSPPPAGRS
jgi:O-antigen/teichoic acid export membrane protein